jgi:hypothetical protein
MRVVAANLMTQFSRKSWGRTKNSSVESRSLGQELAWICRMQNWWKSRSSTVCSILDFLVSVIAFSVMNNSIKIICLVSELSELYYQAEWVFNYLPSLQMQTRNARFSWNSIWKIWHSYISHQPYLHEYMMNFSAGMNSHSTCLTSFRCFSSTSVNQSKFVKFCLKLYWVHFYVSNNAQNWDLSESSPSF